LSCVVAFHLGAAPIRWPVGHSEDLRRARPAATSTVVSRMERNVATIARDATRERTNVARSLGRSRGVFTFSCCDLSRSELRRCVPSGSSANSVASGPFRRSAQGSASGNLDGRFADGTQRRNDCKGRNQRANKRRAIAREIATRFHILLFRALSV